MNEGQKLVGEMCRFWNGKIESVSRSCVSYSPEAPFPYEADDWRDSLTTPQPWHTCSICGNGLVITTDKRGNFYAVCMLADDHDRGPSCRKKEDVWAAYEQMIKHGAEEPE